MELAAALGRAGHIVETFSLDEAKAEGGSSSTNAGSRWIGVRESSFSRSLGAFIRRNASRFDVIDANQTDIQAEKAELGFDGLLVCRSVGLIRRYYELDVEMHRQARSRNGPLRWLDRVRAGRGMRRAVAQAERSLRTADLVNVSSRDDVKFLLERDMPRGKLICFPLGLSAERRESLGGARKHRGARRAESIVFIGTWNPRKGATDWPTVVAKTRALEPGLRFLFLGVGVSARSVLAQFAENDRAAVTVRERYRFEELPSLLGEADVGAFPGYLEGFGIGVLEMLASGLPVVAYDSPGPRDILRGCGAAALVPQGDVDSFVRSIARLVALGPHELAELGNQAAAWSSRFDWARIARETADCYEERLRTLRAKE
jgi:glycosyltransferase involved in cell wall biosynthesis